MAASCDTCASSGWCAACVKSMARTLAYRLIMDRLPVTMCICIEREKLACSRWLKGHEQGR